MSAPGRQPRSSWLCPTDADVRRFYDALEGTNRSRRQVQVILACFAAVATPWLGTASLALLIAAIVFSVLANRVAASTLTSIYAGLIISFGFQIVLSLGVAYSGGLHSPYLPWLTVPVTLTAARYRRAVLLVSLCVATALGALACGFAEVADTRITYPDVLDGLMCLALTCALAAIALNFQQAEIESRTAASSDPLTGLLNRKELDLDYRRLTVELKTGQDSLCLLLFDLDHFKHVNDTYGHGKGDEVLRGVSDVLSSHLRPGDRVYRLGGEEFVALLPYADLAQGVEVAERIRAVLASGPTAGVAVTISVGVASTRTGAPQEQLLEAADRALYVAKSEGRDRVRTAAPA